MSAFEIIVIVALATLVALGSACIFLILRIQPPSSWGDKLESIDIRLSDNLAVVNLGIQGLRDESKSLRDEVSKRFGELGSSTQETLRTIGSQLSERFDAFGKQLTDHRSASGEESKLLRTELSDSLGQLGKTVEGRLDKIRTENADKLEQMRVTVDEKLQGTLEKRLGASFSQVNQNLERVYKSVGEMQALATGVGDLKRVLSNIKTRGTWGEGSLGTLLEQVLTPEQYAQNIEINPGSGQRVEYGIKLPGQEDDPVWLPIDAKLPTGDYERLVQASEKGESADVEAAAKGLERTIVACAKDICSKYVHPPRSTDFAVMFLPTEGLFAEVVRRPGLVDQLQRECRVIVTGPTTLMALLNSLRMGFRTLAIQERSSEVWQVLGAVKSEFGKFGEVIDKVHKKLGEAQNVVEQARTRRRAVDRKLRDVEALPEAAARDVLSTTVEEILDDNSPLEDAAE